MALSPLDINTAARQRYNAINDDFWTDAEIYLLIYQGLCELATEGLIIEQSYTTSSVVNQQQYNLPTNALNVKRITYAGRKLFPITFREDDVLTVLNQATTATGTVTSYALWNDILYLRNIPATTGDQIKIFCNIEPQTVTASSTIEIRPSFQMSLVNFLLSEFDAKNKNYVGAAYYRKLWENDVRRASKMNRKGKIGDAFQIVKNVDILPQSDLGNI